MEFLKRFDRRSESVGSTIEYAPIHWTLPTSTQVSDFLGAFDVSMQHHLGTDLFIMTKGKWSSRLSPAQKSDVWNRWKAGQTPHEIGRFYGKWHNSIRKVLLPRGGIPPITRRRSRLALTLAEPEHISRGIACGSSIREIASRLGRAASTVSREVDSPQACPPVAPLGEVNVAHGEICDQRSGTERSNQ